MTKTISTFLALAVLMSSQSFAEVPVNIFSCEADGQILSYSNKSDLPEMELSNGTFLVLSAKSVYNPGSGQTDFQAEVGFRTGDFISYSMGSQLIDTTNSRIDWGQTFVATNEGVSVTVVCSETRN